MNAEEKILVQDERELDVLVAEHVMGWTFFESKHGYWRAIDPDGKNHTSFAPHFDPCTGEQISPSKTDVEGLPYCSMAGTYGFREAFDFMFQVISKVMETAFGYSLGQNQESLPWCEFQGNTTVRREGPTLAIALCLAALSSKGIEVDYQPRSDRS